MTTRVLEPLEAKLEQIAAIKVCPAYLCLRSQSLLICQSGQVKMDERAAVKKEYADSISYFPQLHCRVVACVNGLCDTTRSHTQHTVEQNPTLRWPHRYDYYYEKMRKLQEDQHKERVRAMHSPAMTILHKTDGDREDDQRVIQFVNLSYRIKLY